MGQSWNRKTFYLSQTEILYFLWKSKIHCWVDQFFISITAKDLSLNTWEQLHSRKDNREQRDSCLRQEHKERDSPKEYDYEWERCSDQWDNERELGLFNNFLSIEKILSMDLDNITRIFNNQELLLRIFLVFDPFSQENLRKEKKTHILRNKIVEKMFVSFASAEEK